MNAPDDESAAFDALLAELDGLLDQYDPGALEPDRVVREIMQERARQRPLFERAVEHATAGLERFPNNGELLRRRGFALCRIVTPDGVYPRLEEAKRDLRAILRFEPNNIRAGFDLLHMLFTFSGLDDAEVATIAEQLAAQAQDLMLSARTLQIRALLYARKKDEAERLAATWTRLFPDDRDLAAAIGEFSDLIDDE